MILEYTVTKKDYENVICGDLAKRNKSGKFLGCALLFLAAISTIALVLMIRYVDNIVAVLPTLFMVLLFAFGLAMSNKRVQAKLALRERIKSGGIEPEYFGPHTLEVTEYHLILRFGNIEGERHYGGIDRVEEYKGVVAIYTSSMQCDIIPNSAFRNAEQRHSFISLLKSRMAAAKDVPVEGETVGQSRAEARCSIDYSWDEPGLINAFIQGNRAIFKTRLFWTPGRIIATFVALLLLFAGSRIPAYDVDFILLMPNIILLAIGSGLLLPLVMVFTPWIRSIVTKQVRDGIIPRSMIGNHTLCVYDDKLSFYSRLHSNDLNIEQVYCVKRSGDTLLLMTKAKMLNPIPVSAFTSETTLDEFISFIKSKTGRKK